MRNRLLATAFVVPLVFSVGQSQALTVDSNCDYTDTTISKTAGTITATRNYKSETADYQEKHRICVVKFDANVNGTWQKAHAQYIFGPNLSEDAACEKAKEKAKVKVLEQFASVEIGSEVQSTCVETLRSNPKVVYVERPKTAHVERPKIVYVARPVYIKRRVYVNRPIVQNNPYPRIYVRRNNMAPYREPNYGNSFYRAPNYDN